MRLSGTCRDPGASSPGRTFGFDGGSFSNEKDRFLFHRAAGDKKHAEQRWAAPVSTCMSRTTPMFSSLPLGARMPESVHAVTCSIPTMGDVIGYEEKDPQTMAQITSGYPRFVTHFYIRRMEEDWRQRHGLQGRDLFFTASPEAALHLRRFVADEDALLLEEEGLRALHAASGSPAAARAKAFLQHAGCGISSRLAEDYLHRHKLITAVQNEELAGPETAQERVTDAVAEAFRAPATAVSIAVTGMNAFYALFRSISAIQAPRGRHLWVQLGWLYVDTIEILRKMTAGEGRHIVLNDPFDLAALERLLETRGGEIAGVVTEVPTNPLIQAPDILRLRELTQRHDIPLVLDPTLASPHNIEVLPHCDAAVISLTKYAGSQGDVMMGAVVLNPDSRWATQLQPAVESLLTPPFLGDVRRLAVEIADWRPVVDRINENTTQLASFLATHPAVDKIYWAYSEASRANYSRIHRREAAPGGIVTIKLRGAIAEFYDRVQVSKGPSFGLTFTILCPFMYLAHYDLVSTRQGREVLQRHNLDADLIRISVGAEESGRIIAAFADAL